MLKKVLKKVFRYFGVDIIRLKNIPDESVVLPGSFGSISDIVQKIGPEIVYHMAATGEGTDSCMEKGCLPVLTHFYQPIPNLKELEYRNVWEKVSKLRGIDWQPERFLANLQELSKYADECEWPNNATENPMDFFIDNTCFSYGCASALHCFIRRNKPKRIIEVGSGNSSRVIAAALKANIAQDTGYQPEYTIIDPYSQVDVNFFPTGTSLIKEQVEVLDPDFFRQLSNGDLLFIDSSHVSKIGSDVNFEILEVLPTLQKGVFVHFHDIDLPYEYSKVYAYTPTFRMFWTEAYLLQAFLSCNPYFEIVLPLAYIQREKEIEFRKLFPKGNTAKLWGSGSFWIRRST